MDQIEYLSAVPHYFVDRITFDGFEIRERTLQEHELVWITAGQLTVRINGTAHCPKAGTLLYFSPGLAHSFDRAVREQARFYGLHFSFRAEGLAPEQALPIPPLYLPKRPQLLSGLFDAFDRTWNQKEHYAQFQRCNRLNDLLCALLCDVAAPSGGEDPRVAAARARIAQDCTVTPAALIAASGVSKVYFERIFHAATGQTPGAFIRAARIARAKKLLDLTERPVREIAALCGYEDELYFSRVFRAAEGMPPTAYRKRTDLFPFIHV